MRIDSPAAVGVLSDTHGILAPEVMMHFAAVELIIHAGDVGSPLVLMELEALAPVVAVRGNTDEARWAENLPLREIVTVDHLRIAVAHEMDALSSRRADVMVYGHTHRPEVQWRDGSLYLNPGSASNPRGSGATPTVAVLDIADGKVHPRIIRLG